MPKPRRITDLNNGKYLGTQRAKKSKSGVWRCRVCLAPENETFRATCYRCGSYRTTEDEDSGKNPALDRRIKTKENHGEN